MQGGHISFKVYIIIVSVHKVCVYIIIIFRSVIRSTNPLVRI